jgi:DNA-binding MarR family transcriptional regulator
MPSTIPDLTDHTGYWLRMVSNSVSQAFAQKVADHGVTVAEWVFLRALYDQDDIAPTALADRMGMTRGAISKLADRLAAKGLIERAAAGARGQALALTPEGRAKVPHLARLADVNDQDFFGILTPEEHQTLNHILKTLAERRGLYETPVD